MLAERLRERRIARRLKNGQVVAYLAISAAHLSDMESGKNKPSVDLLARLAEYYRTSADYLLGLSDDPTPPGRAEAPPPHAEELVDLLRSLSPYNGDRLLAIAEALFDHQQRAAERAGERDEALRLLASHVGGPAAALIDELVAEAVTTGRTAVLLSGLARLGLPKEGEDLPEE